MKQIIITLPDGYEDTKYLVLVTAEERGFASRQMDYAATVLSVNESGHTSEVEEIGEAGLSSILGDAAVVIRSYHTALRRGRDAVAAWHESQSRKA